MKKLDGAAAVAGWRADGNEPVGFVPTMGALHDGHLALIARARRDCARVIVSLFVNPAQFNDPVDLRDYPRPLAADLEKLRAAGADAVFLPEPGEIYADGYRFEVREKVFSRVLCGAARPGHFEGVLTVVLKLLMIVRPARAYFGEKDFQQLSLIRDMCQAFFLPVEIVACPTVREADGLAMSSRNLLLTPEQRSRAPLLHQALTSAGSAAEARRRLESGGFDVDYVEDRDGRRYAAARLGAVRLIDNVEI